MHREKLPKVLVEVLFKSKRIEIIHGLCKIRAVLNLRGLSLDIALWPVLDPFSPEVDYIDEVLDGIAEFAIGQEARHMTRELDKLPGMVESQYGTMGGLAKEVATEHIAEDLLIFATGKAAKGAFQQHSCWLQGSDCEA
jgi:hypothetical protein